MPAPLPPTPRDFEIHRLSLIEFLPTRRIAEKFDISPTRVRQIIAAVSRWLAETLPVPTTADLEKEQRLAIHLAAAQLQHQIEQLQVFWQQTCDPKYLRQQTRAILALARLGVTPGALDSLAANSGIGVPPVQSSPSADRRAGISPADVDVDVPTPDFQPPTSNLCPTPSLSPSSPQNSAFSPQPSSFPPPPPSRDCSPNSVPPAPPWPDSAEDFAESNSPATTCDDDPNFLATQSQGLTLMENRLLTLLGNTADSDHDRRHAIEQTLNNIRQENASLLLKLAPYQPVAPPSQL